MIRAVGALTVLLAASLLGYRKAFDLEGQYRQLEELRNILYMLEGEIRYSRSYLSEAFHVIGERVEEPYQSWLEGMYRKMEERAGGSFPKVWEEETKQFLKQMSVPDKEKRRLAGLGRYLGSGDIKMQMTQLELHVEQLELTMEEQQRELGSKKKLFKVLGVAGGALLAILLI